MNPPRSRRSAAPGPLRAPGAALLLAALLATACGPEAPAPGPGGAGRPPPREPDPIAVSAAPVVRQPLSEVYSTSGTLRAERTATVTSRTRGVIEQIFVEEGDEVTAGQALAQLENNEQELAVERYETIHAIKVREYERLSKLNADELITNTELEVAAQQVEELENDLDLARLELERTTVAAPFEGTVVRRHLDLGATVSDGTEIFDLADIDPLYLDVSVPERHVARLAPGQTVQIFADAADIAAEARIERLSPVVDVTTGTVKVTVAVDSDVELRPGAFVEVDVVTEVHEDALVVPRSALVAEGRRWLVYRVGAAGDRAEALEVTLGFEQGDRVEVAGVVGADPLQPGELIVVRGASALSDGARIAVTGLPEATPAETAEGDGATAGSSG